MGSFSNTAVDLAPAEVYRRMQEEDLILIDVWESYEWEASAAWVDAGLPIEPADGRVAPH